MENSNASNTTSLSWTSPIGAAVLDSDEPVGIVKLITKLDLTNPAIQQVDDLLKLLSYDISWLISFVLSLRHKHQSHDHIEHALQMHLYQRAEDLGQPNLQLKFGMYGSSFQSAIQLIDTAIAKAVLPLLSTLDSRYLNTLNSVNYLGQGNIVIEIASEDPDDAPPIDAEYADLPGDL